MAANAQKVFHDSVLPLSPAERLRLAALILRDLTEGGSLLIETSDAWSDDDERDLIAFSLRHAAAAYPDEDELVAGR